MNITRYVTRADPEVCARMLSGHANARVLALACTQLPCFPALLEAKLFEMLFHKSPRLPGVVICPAGGSVMREAPRCSKLIIASDNPSLHYLFFTWIPLNLQEVIHTHGIKPHRPDGSFVNGVRQGTSKLKVSVDPEANSLERRFYKTHVVGMLSKNDLCRFQTRSEINNFEPEVP